MRYKTIEFIIATEYKPELGKLYYLGADGNIYETTMGPKSKGYKAPMVVELNLKREKGWLYFFKQNPDVVYDIVENEKKARYPKESVLEVWRCLESSKYGISDMTKEEREKEIAELEEKIKEESAKPKAGSKEDTWLTDARDDEDGHDGHDDGDDGHDDDHDDRSGWWWSQ